MGKEARQQNAKSRPANHLPGWVVLLVLAGVIAAIWAYYNLGGFNNSSAYDPKPQQSPQQIQQLQREQAAQEHLEQVTHQLANIVDVEADARVGIFSARSIAASIRIIREGGYRCDSLSFIAGYETQERVSCNGNRYSYILQDNGAGWFVTPAR